MDAVETEKNLSLIIIKDRFFSEWEPKKVPSVRSKYENAGRVPCIFTNRMASGDSGPIFYYATMILYGT